MNRGKRFIRSLIAVFIAVVMIGTTATAAVNVAYAAEPVVAEEGSSDIFSLFSKVIESFYNFISGIINFFRNGMQGDLFEEEVVTHKVSTEEELRAAFMAGGEVYLLDSITCDGMTSVVIPEGVDVVLHLRGFTLTNKIAAAAAIVNRGNLMVYGDGAIVNGSNEYRGSHTIENHGKLSINGGDIGTFETAGAAVRNFGVATILDGNFASRQAPVKGDICCEYVFVNNAGVMVIYDAVVNGCTQGIVYASGGTVTLNGGTFVFDGNGGLGSYAVHAKNDAEVILTGGVLYANNVADGNVFCVGDKTDNMKFNKDAVDTSNITFISTQVYIDGAQEFFAGE